LGDTGGRFELPSVPPGRYLVNVSGAGTWSPRTAIFGGRDVLDTLIDVVPDQNVTGLTISMTPRQSSIDGVVLDAAGQPTADCTLVVFAADPQFWSPKSRHIQAVRPSTDGRFDMTGLPAGEYRLAAVTDVEPEQWTDPAFLRQLMGTSMPITLMDGERKQQDVRMVR
jgi:hypothetical protein